MNNKEMVWLTTLTVVLCVIFVIWIIYVCVKCHKVNYIMDTVPFNSNQADSVQTKYLLYTMLNNQLCCLPFVSNDKIKQVFMTTQQQPQDIVLEMMYLITEKHIVYAPKLFDEILNMPKNNTQTQENFEQIPDVPKEFDNYKYLVDIEWC